MKFYTAFEVADLLKVSEGTIGEWMRKGKLGATKLGGTKTVRINDEDLKGLYDTNRVAATEKE